MHADGNSGDAIDLERAHDAIEIVALDARGRRRIDAHQLVVKEWGPALGSNLLQLAPDFIRSSRSAEDSAAQRSKIKPAPAHHQRMASAPRDVDNRRARHRDEFRDVERLVGHANIYKVMRHAAALLGSRLRGADIHPAVQLTRLGSDDFGAEPLRERHRDRGLPGSGRPHDKADLDPRGGFAHRRNIRSICPRAKLIWTGRPCGQLVLNWVRSSSTSSSRISRSSSARPTRTEP